MMNRRYEKVLKEYGFTCYEYYENNSLFYDISGNMVHYQCSADRFPEMFIQYGLSFNAVNELEKEAEKRDMSVDELFNFEGDLREVALLLAFAAVRLVKAEKELALETLTGINRAVLYLLSETETFVSKNQSEFHVCLYTDFGMKYQIVCKDTEHILEGVRIAYQDFDRQRYFTEQMELIEKGNRIQIPRAQLISESEAILEALAELLNELEDLQKEDRRS